MPLKTGKSKKTVSSNIRELKTSAPTKARQKGINTLASRRGISKKQAKHKQAFAIALNKARKT